MRVFRKANKPDRWMTLAFAAAAASFLIAYALGGDLLWAAVVMAGAPLAGYAFGAWRLRPSP